MGRLLGSSRSLGLSTFVIIATNIQNNLMLQYAFSKKPLVGTSKNPIFIVMLLRKNPQLLKVNSGFSSVASLEYRIFRSPLVLFLLNLNSHNGFAKAFEYLGL
jgi:hypothetical protein